MEDIAMETEEGDFLETKHNGLLQEEEGTSNQVPRKDICSEEALHQKSRLIYGVNDRPPWHMTILFAIQHVCLSLNGAITMPLITTTLICAGHLESVRAQIVSTYLVTSGLSTLLQSGLGVRLPVIQGSSNAYVLSTMAIMRTEGFQCPTRWDPVESNNITNSSVVDETEIWQVRMREIQGAITLAAFTEVILGCTGVFGFMLHYISPITIACTISLAGIGLYPVATDLCNQQWGIAVMTVALILLFSVYINRIHSPCPSVTTGNATRRCRIVKLPIFEMFSVVLAVGIAWAFCGLLTAVGAFPDDPKQFGYTSRTDARMHSLYSSPWFFAPYPGQWGFPTVSIASYLGMLGAVVASMVESVGDYYATAGICGLPTVPHHAVNRGLAMEGLGGVISGILGSGGACTSYSQHIGAIGITRVASRVVFICAGILFLVVGVFGKLGALLSMMPDPILGGVCLVTFGLIISIGLSNLSLVDMSSTRNQVVVGVALITGLIIPDWLHTNADALSTGNTHLDQTLQVMCGSPMFLGGLTAFLLDNSVPGTLKERGIIRGLKNVSSGSSRAESLPAKNQALYDIPLITKCLSNKKWAQYVPILPTFRPGMWFEKCKCLLCGKCKAIPKETLNRI